MMHGVVVKGTFTTIGRAAVTIPESAVLRFPPHVFAIILFTGTRQRKGVVLSLLVSVLLSEKQSPSVC